MQMFLVANIISIQCFTQEYPAQACIKDSVGIKKITVEIYNNVNKIIDRLK